MAYSELAVIRCIQERPPCRQLVRVTVQVADEGVAPTPLPQLLQHDARLQLIAIARTALRAAGRFAHSTLAAFWSNRLASRM